MAPCGTTVFPTLHACTKLGTDDTLFDVQFWPFGTSDDEQIFAITGATDTFVCRPRLDADPPFDILAFFRDEVDREGPKASLNSLVWAPDPVSKKPWLCVAGDGHQHIKILDIESGNVARAMSGHGAAVNDLALSPLATSLLASCSQDSTIRLWSLDPALEAQPCVALFAGEGHKAPVLHIEFHPNGKWLLSGGIDTAICLWAVPDVTILDRDGRSSAAEPLIVYYPHFFTEELHPNYVDCLAWYGDLIISKAGRDQNGASNSNEILLWKIEGFDADDAPAEEPPIPEPGQQTRSSFAHTNGERGFFRLLTMSIPHTDRFYHLFGLLDAEGMRPILCMGDQLSRYSFWDLQRFDEGTDPQSKPSLRPAKEGRKKAPNVVGELRQLESASSSASDQTPDTSSTATSPAAASGDREYTLNDRFTALAPHHQTIANTDLSRKGGAARRFATSKIAWSPDGTWMVAVGDIGMICMFHRDKSVL